MTPEQIRAEAIERLARADYTGWLERVRAKAVEWGETCEHLPWDEAPDEGEWGRDKWRRIHAPQVDALGDMLPTEVRWKATDSGGPQPGWFPDEASCRASWDRVNELADIPRTPPTVMRQYVTGWQEVTE